MKIGPYALSAEGIPSALLNALDSLRLRLRGAPGLPGDTPVEIANEVLKRNARKVLHAGSGHFWFMRVADFALALRGAEKTLSPSYLRGLIEYMIRQSMAKGAVPSCYTALHGFNMPQERADSLPFLIYSVAEYGRWVGDKRLFEENENSLQWLLGEYERRMETALKASSIAAHLCALELLLLGRELGLKVKTDPSAFAAAVLESRWREDRFSDRTGNEDWEAGALALYFQLFDKGLRQSLIKRFETAHWAKPHLILIALNGLKKSGVDVSAHKARMDALVMKHRQFIEELDENEKPRQALLRGSEYGLTLAAGQYLELALS